MTTTTPSIILSKHLLTLQTPQYPNEFHTKPIKIRNVGRYLTGVKNAARLYISEINSEIKCKNHGSWKIV